MSPSSLTTPLLVSVWPTSLLVPTLSIPLLVPMLSMTDVRKKAAISATTTANIMRVLVRTAIWLPFACPLLS